MFNFTTSLFVSQHSMIMLTQTSTGRISFDTSGESFDTDYIISGYALSRLDKFINTAFHLNCIIDNKYYTNVRVIQSIYPLTGSFILTAKYSDEPSYLATRKITLLTSIISE